LSQEFSDVRELMRQALPLFASPANSSQSRSASDGINRVQFCFPENINRHQFACGDQLSDFVIGHGLGVTTTKPYEIREVSNDFFDESEL
jgi:restriction endonuclease Mrr